MESFQKRDRDRKKQEKRTVKETRRKERAERRRNGPSPDSIVSIVEPALLDAAPLAPSDALRPHSPT